MKSNLDSISKLTEAKELLISELAKHISSISYRETMRELRVNFIGGAYVFIRYNDYGEYGYQVMFSDNKSDYERYDNFDDKWDIKTKPHHFHKLNPREVVESPMNGDPIHDMPIFSKYIVDTLDF